MRITVHAEELTIIAAIAHALAYGNDVRSKMKCLSEVQGYISLYGASCVDDHTGEYSDHMDQAKELFKKYFVK